jgi:small subunit ribosomal protein S3Ae
MAIGKNKRLSKGKKGSKKKAVDPFLRKEMYTIKAPSMFKVRNAGKTIITKTTGNKIASEGLKGRVFELCLSDLMASATGSRDESLAYRKIRLICEDVQGTNVVTNFHGMDMTRDKVCSLIKKWHSLIEAFVDVKTTDGYYLRVFCIGFTKKQKTQRERSTCYATGGQIRAIRKTMFDIISEECEKCDLKDLVAKFMTESMSFEIEKRCEVIFPLQNVHIRKCKVLKKPKFDLVKLMEFHDSTGEDTGAKIDKVDAETRVSKLTGAGGRL